MSIINRREIPMIIILFTAGLMLAEYYFVVPTFKDVASEFKIWAVIISGFVLFFGGYSIIKMHLSNIVQRREGQWYLSIYLLALLFIMSLFGIIFGVTNDVYVWCLNYLYNPCSVTVYSLTAFYVFSYAFAAFRIRTYESAFLFFSAFFVILSNIPAGAAIWPPFKDIGNWIMTVVQMGANRGIYISIAIGAIVLSFRVILGMERGSRYGGEGKYGFF